MRKKSRSSEAGEEEEEAPGTLEKVENRNKKETMEDQEPPKMDSLVVKVENRNRSILHVEGDLNPGAESEASA